MLATIRAKIREDGQYHFGRWGTFWHRFAVAPWRWSVALCKFPDHWALHLFCLWVTLWKTRTEPEEIMESWGFTFDPFGDSGPPSLHLSWGARTKVLWLPWSLEWVRTEHMMPDGSFVTVEKASHLPRRLGGRRLYLRPDGSLRPAPDFPRGSPLRGYFDWTMPKAPGRYKESFPYRYTLRNGGVQAVTATVTAERMTHTYRLPYLLGIFWPKKVRTSIQIEFDGEVGEGAGSWKGGCVGCGWELRPGETPSQCLRRMESERKFSR